MLSITVSKETVSDVINELEKFFKQNELVRSVGICVDSLECSYSATEDICKFESIDRDDVITLYLSADHEDDRNIEIDNGDVVIFDGNSRVTIKKFEEISESNGYTLSAYVLTTTK